MIVDRNSWHARVYSWWYSKKYDFPFEKTRSNLCPYMRAVMFWAPLRALFLDSIQLFRVWKTDIYLNWFLIPITMYVAPKLLGYFNYDTKMVFWIIYMAVGLVCGVLGLAALVIYVFHPDGLGVSKKVESASFYRLLSEYLRSAHDRVCPEVEIN